MSLSKDVTEIFTFIHDICQISQYPISLFQNHNLMFFDGIKPNLYPVNTDDKLRDQLLKSSKTVFDEEYTYIYYYVQHYSEQFTCMIGPLSIRELTPTQCSAYLRSHHVQNYFKYYILHASVPQAITAINLITDKLSPLSISNSEEQFITEPAIAYTDSEDLHYEIQSYQLNQTEKEHPSFPYLLVDRLRNALQSGNNDAFFSALSEASGYTSGVSVPNNFKQAEYTAVSYIAVLTDSVIAGGASLADAYSISDCFIEKIAEGKTISDLYHIMEQASVRFLQLSKQHIAENEQSYHVRACKNYISHHLNQPLNPNLLAQALNISKDYLLHSFSRDEGTTLMKYIQKERIHAAQNMLKYSDYEILRIAEYFHFKTQSHFGAVFKKYTGMSPAAYRQKNKPLHF